MSRISLILAVYDASYTKKLVNYFMEHYSHVFDIYSFSECVNLKAFIYKNHKKLDILLAEPTFPDFDSLSDNVEITIGLVDSLSYNSPEKQYSISKFTHVEVLVKNILDIYAERIGGKVAPRANDEALIVTVGSSSGGSGKSSIAAGLAILAARRGMKVLYLNLESLSSTDLYFKSSIEGNFSEAIYHIKEKSNSLAVKLEGLCCYDEDLKVHYFKPPDSAFQMEELNLDDMEVLIGAIRTSPIFGAVVIDTTDKIGLRELLIMRESGINVRVCTPEPVSALKEEMLEKALINKGKDLYEEFISNCIYVLNKYPDDGEECFPESMKEKFGVVIGLSERLRGYNGDRSIADMDDLFTKSLLMLFDLIISKNGKKKQGRWEDCMPRLCPKEKSLSKKSEGLSVTGLI